MEQMAEWETIMVGKINTVIFDIGKVLVGYSWRDLFDRVFKGKEGAQELRTILFEGDRLWDEVDRGAIPIDEVIATIISKAPRLEKEIMEFMNNLGTMLWQYDHSKPWINGLKERGYRTLFLSNYSHFLIEQNRECLDFLPLLDGGIFSCDVHLIKPDHRIYEALIEKYQLEPSKCVFIDDKPENIKGAIECGLNGIVMTDFDSTNAQLEELLAQ